jgi:LPXTG-motif cell wall-anchored protein
VPSRLTLVTVVVALLALGLALGLALSTARAGVHFIADLNLREPLVRRIGPRATGHNPPPLSHRVILVIVDGLREDTSRQMPYLAGLAVRGARGQADSLYPTLSHPNYVSILSGVEPRVSGVRNNRFLAVVPLDSILAEVHAAGLGTAYVSDFTTGIGQLYTPAIDDGVVIPWRGGLERAIAHLVARDDAALVVVHPGQVDVAGHTFGGASLEYQLSAAGVDGMLAEALATVDLARDTIIVTADHGHVDRGGHGGLEPEVVHVPLVMVGAGIRAGAALEPATLLDLAPTIARLLGVNCPSEAFGHVLLSALDLDPAEGDRIRTADLARVSVLQAMVTSALSQREREGGITRGSRLALSISGVAILLAAILVCRRRKILRIDRRVLAASILPFPLLFYGLLGFIAPFTSPSSLPETGEIEQTLFLFGGGAALLALVAMWLAVAWRPVPQVRLATATGVALIGLLIVFLPAAFAWIVAGPPVRFTLPGPHVLFLPVVAYAGVTCYAGAAALVLLVELGIFFARITSRPGAAAD